MSPSVLVSGFSPSLAKKHHQLKSNEHTVADKYLEEFRLCFVRIERRLPPTFTVRRVNLKHFNDTDIDTY